MSFYQHPTAVIDEDCQIGEGTKIWHFTHIMSDSIIGNDCNLGQNVVVSSQVELGNNVKVQNNVSIYTGVVCRDNVFLGPSMVFTNVVNPRSGVNRKAEYLPTILEEGVTVGANATILCGIKIGKFAFIGAGAMVVKDVPDYALMVGNPAKQIGWMSEYGERLKFDKNGYHTCNHTGEKYCFDSTKVIKV